MANTLSQPRQTRPSILTIRLRSIMRRLSSRAVSVIAFVVLCALVLLLDWRRGSPDVLEADLAVSTRPWSNANRWIQDRFPLQHHLPSRDLWEWDSDSDAGSGSRSHLHPHQHHESISRNNAAGTDSARWINLDDNMRWTEYAGGIEGYNVFSNLFLVHGTLIAAFSDEKPSDMPKPAQIMSNGKNPGRSTPDAEWETIIGANDAKAELGSRAVRVPGTTYIFNDPPGAGGLLVYYGHFMSEVFLPSISVASAVAANHSLPLEDHTVPSRLIFPRCQPDNGWRDANRQNAGFLERVLPGVQIEDGTWWADHAVSPETYVFDHVVIVDRWSAHSAREASMWGKMNAKAATVRAPLQFFAPFRRNALAWADGALPDIGKHNLPIVVLVDSPQMSQRVRRALVEAFKPLTTRAEIHIAKLSDMSDEERVQLYNHAAVVVDKSSDSLFNMIWMEGGATVVELFEQGGFQRDKELVAEILNINHIAIQEDKLLTREEWMAAERKRGPGANKAWDGDVDLIVQAVTRVLDGLDEHGLGAQVEDDE